MMKIFFRKEKKNFLYVYRLIFISSKLTIIDISLFGVLSIGCFLIIYDIFDMFDIFIISWARGIKENIVCIPLTNIPQLMWCFLQPVCQIIIPDDRHIKETQLIYFISCNQFTNNCSSTEKYQERTTLYFYYFFSYFQIKLHLLIKQSSTNCRLTISLYL